MENIKNQILERICYSNLVYDRINKKLQKSLSNKEIEKMVFDILRGASVSQYQKKGKNIYVTHFHIRITINSTTYRVITADLIVQVSHRNMDQKLNNLKK